MVGIQNTGQAGQIHHYNESTIYLYIKQTQTSPTLHVLLLGNVKDTKATENMTLYLKKKKHLLFERYQDVC